MKKQKIGICGVGTFSRCFVPLFQAHPLTQEVVLADLVPERLKEAADAFGVKRTCGSMDELMETDVDAVAIFVQRHLHGPLTIQALEAGKNVYCAVPMASNLEEIRRILELVEEKRLIYMNGETSYYYPSALYCRDRFRKGDFGDFVFGEGAYYHDMSHGFYRAFQHSGGANWKRVAGFPPMYYPTHSTSLVLSVTGARATHVSCLGVRDHADDHVFEVGANEWDNVFSNETALMRTSDGGMMRINEFRRVGWWSQISGNPMSLYGTKGSFEETAFGQCWTGLEKEELKDVTGDLRCARHVSAKQADENLHEVLQRDFHSDYSKSHPTQRLPEVFIGMQNGHMGSHQFLVDDFVKSLGTKKLPLVNAWEAAKYCVPGLIAHESALRNGEQMEIPDTGHPPSDWDLLDPNESV
ncbi:Gfo/Idh/MocA family oxidoreductase [bacterium]|nr:Gfo/Idh/MocA family oxidoreductase [bacterium]